MIMFPTLAYFQCVKKICS